MISNQVIQNTIEGFKAITRMDITVGDRDGRLVASTEEGGSEIPASYVASVLQSPADNQTIQGNQYFRVLDNGIAEYVLVVKGDDEEAFRLGKLAAFQIQTLVMAYKEKYDRDNFIKNLLMDNLLLVDIYSRANKLQIESGLTRVVFLIETPAEAQISAMAVLRNLFPERQRDFVTAVDETSIILVKELREESRTGDLNIIAKEILDTLTAETMTDPYVAIGGIVSDLKNVSSSFKEARLAQEVGKIFETEKQIVNYRSLGIGRLVYQLPLPLCRMFMSEMLQGFSVDDIDEEMFITVTKFFENDLNVSETSRELFIHRNTLVYRLDKLEKMTKLDLRKFSDAITFKIVLMVSKFLKYREAQ